MYIRSLYLQNFRNYGEANVEFSPEINLICGPNALGKTTLLEAIHYFMLGRSFRTNRATDLIHHGKESFLLHTQFAKHNIDQRLHISFETGERKIIYNSTQLNHVSGLLGVIQGVVITPDDINLIKGAPVLRRQYLDIQIAQLDPVYVHHLTRYNRALRHRNHLLKTKQMITMDGWEHEMAQSAAYIVFQRQRAVLDLQKSCLDYYAILAGEDEILSLSYKSSVSESKTLQELKEAHLNYFHKQRERELRIGFTVGGPHKDDLFISIGDKEVRHFASVGQQHSCVAAMHLAEWQRLKDMSGETPILMVDDIGISLDESRKKRLLSLLSGMGQVFLTTTDESLLAGGTRLVIRVPLAPLN